MLCAEKIESQDVAETRESSVMRPSLHFQPHKNSSLSAISYLEKVSRTIDFSQKNWNRPTIVGASFLDLAKDQMHYFFYNNATQL